MALLTMPIFTAIDSPWRQVNRKELGQGSNAAPGRFFLGGMPIGLKFSSKLHWLASGNLSHNHLELWLTNYG